MSIMLFQRDYRVDLVSAVELGDYFRALYMKVKQSISPIDRDWH